MLKTYQTVENATLSGRELEASVLRRAAMRMAAVRDNWERWDAAERDAQLDEALRYNQRLWTLFQSELSDADNPLPNEIKRNLLALSAFIDKRTFEVLSYPDPRKLDILIEINRNIAAGLQPH
ncbi:MAG: flagellar biosynthesis regulator FlaF [Methylophilaceae bacterium]|nr:flagellar biosynthesis regulator FlaF [Methylophilaceae bacterium]